MTALGKDGLHSKSVSYLLWMGWLFGFGGLHRFYLGKPVSGFFYVITWGFFGIGQMIDLFRLPGLVRRQRARGLDQAGAEDWVHRSDEANARLVAATRGYADAVLVRTERD